MGYATVQVGSAKGPDLITTSPVPGVATLDEEAWRAFIGPKNTDYYLDRFRSLSARQGGGWHWPAFFVTWYWLLYRRMFAYAIGYMLLPYFFLLAIGVILGAVSGGGDAQHWILVIIAFTAFWVAPALVGNRLYFRHGRKQIEKLSLTLRSREALLGALAARGGSSGIVTILIVFFAAVALIGLMAAIALPAYQDYTKRAKAHEALQYGRETAQNVLAHWRRTQTVPQSLEELVDVLPQTVPPSVRTAATVDKNGAVLVHLKDGSGSLTLTPRSDGTISCTSQLLRKQWAPAICRE